MNKAITDGLVLMPPPFSAGLTQWSREDGTPGSANYDGWPNAAYVPSDQDFGGCLEVYKTDSVQKLRWTGEVPILPGCYLRVTARVKAINGNLPRVRIAGWAGGAGSGHVAQVVESGPEIELTSYGEVLEVSAILGSGARTGVDMVWGKGVIYGHLGLDLVGATGGVVRIDDLVIEDVTSVFHREMMDWVDVRDFGAIGDGITDDSGAFALADTAASGRRVLVPAGVYRLAESVTLDSEVRFVGTITMPEEKRLILRRNFELQSYIAAFGDEVIAFRKAFQALLGNSDHDALDLAGRRIDLDGPIDMQAAVGDLTTFSVRRTIQNGQFNVVDGPRWVTGTVTSTASYDAGNPYRLGNVANVAQIEVGALVSGSGVGREVYVTAKNVGAGSLTLSQPMYGPAATQTYRFDRFRYVLDFSGFAKLDRMTLAGIDFNCGGYASGVMLAPEGSIFSVQDCQFTKPKDRGVTSIGYGCQGLHVDRCQFISNEMDIDAADRSTIALNVNANDSKIRDNRFARFGHTAILSGSGHLLVGNHLFQGDNGIDTPRQAGIVFCQTNVKSVLTGNYVDNSSIEWTNEHDATPAFSSEFSYGGLSVTGNIFTVNNAANWFAWIVVKPFGAGHYIQGLSVTGNTFKSLNGTTDRIEKLDDSIAGLDFGRSRNIVFEGNTFNGVDQQTINPVTLEFAQNSNSQYWTLDVSQYLPFGGWARTVSSVVAEADILNAANSKVFAAPSVRTNFGANNNQVQLSWPEPCRGTVQVTARMDKPV